ncbi:MAG: hypothetical protein ABFS10_05360 [Bacteroidota bacterium]
MKKLIPAFFVVMILATGCPQPETEIQQVEIGLFTPYVLFPEILNGKVKEVVETNYLGIEQDGKIMKGERLTIDARDSIKWSPDFKLIFDDNGNVLQTLYLDENDEVVKKDVQTVMEGKIVKSETIKGDTLRNYAKFSYNESGHLTAIEVYKLPVDTLAWGALLTVDEQGNYQEWQVMDEKGSPTDKYMFTVNQEDRRTGYKYYNKEGELAFEERYTYNEMGFMSKQEMINKEGEASASEYLYEYDEQDNWVKVTGNSDQYTIITERKITYFTE